MPRIFSSGPEIADFVRKQTGISLAGSQHTQLGIIQNGQVRCGVVFNHFTGTDIHMTAAGSPGAFTKVFLARLGAYLFEELRVARISITTEQPRVVALSERIGAKVEGVKRDAFGPGRDGTMLGLLAKDWRFK
jgi:hypothetical protein